MIMGFHTGHHAMNACIMNACIMIDLHHVTNTVTRGPVLLHNQCAAPDGAPSTDDPSSQALRGSSLTPEPSGAGLVLPHIGKPQSRRSTFSRPAQSRIGSQGGDKVCA